ncbi:sex determination protein fruitless-like isoform X1 [Drosophila takahashii]|uniref:sex determination protein fruitless-like isoform X1 n=1 Tax=Drosophila takahashii TaxID=29030 RepID=UPI003898D71C
MSPEWDTRKSYCKNRKRPRKTRAKMMATSQDYFGNPYALFRGPPTTLRPRESPLGVGHPHGHGHIHSHAHAHGHGHAHSHYAALDLQTPHKRNIETDVRAPPPPLPPPPLPLPAASPR